MANETPVATAPAATQPPVAAASTPAKKPAPIEVTLDQFARETSAIDKRVALLHGFVFDEKRAKRLKDTEANYRTRYEAFAGKPTKCKPAK